VIRRVAAAIAIVCAIVMAVLPIRASATTHDGGVTKFFTNVDVPPGQVVDGDLNVFFGDAHIEGTVVGDVNVFGGSCFVEDGADIRGEQHCVWNQAGRALAPFIGQSALGEFAEADRRMYVKLASSAVVVLVFLLFPVRMRLALDRVERHPGLAALAGLGGAIAIVPLAIALICSIIGIPLILVEIAAVFAAIWLGTGAIALLVGRRLWEVVLPETTPSPFAALIVGLVLVSAAEIVPVVGWAVTALVWLVSLGAAILAFVPLGQRRWNLTANGGR
jgi:hypothetical protein